MFKNFTVEGLEYLPCVSISGLSKDSPDLVEVQAFAIDGNIHQFLFTKMSFHGEIIQLHLLNGMNVLIK